MHEFACRFSRFLCSLIAVGPRHTEIYVVAKAAFLVSESHYLYFGGYLSFRHGSSPLPQLTPLKFHDANQSLQFLPRRGLAGQEKRLRIFAFATEFERTEILVHFPSGTVGLD